MSPLLLAAAVAVPTVVAVALVLHFRGHRLSDYLPTFDRDAWRALVARYRTVPRHHQPPTTTSRFAALEVRAPLHGHETRELGPEQIAAALAEGRDRDGAK